MQESSYIIEVFASTTSWGLQLVFADLCAQRDSLWNSLWRRAVAPWWAAQMPTQLLSLPLLNNGGENKI